jgi:hypothetical protein
MNTKNEMPKAEQTTTTTTASKLRLSKESIRVLTVRTSIKTGMGCPGTVNCTQTIRP